MVRKSIEDYVVITFGLMLLAISIHFFLVPHNLAAGGLSGFAMVLNFYFPFLGVGIIMFVGNLILFIIGFIFIGRDFGVRTVYSSLMLSVMIAIMEKTIPMNKPFTEDVFISLVFGSVIGAIGIGIVFNRNASTGGTDIPAKILNKYLNIDIGKSLLIIDLVVTTLALVVFGAETGMYATLGVVINGFAVDYVIEGLNITKKLEIISEKGDDIRDYIICELKKGVTIYEGRGGFKGEKKAIIITVLEKKEFIKLRHFIRETDEDAFVIVHNVHEVLGNGFKNEK